MASFVASRVVSQYFLRIGQSSRVLDIPQHSPLVFSVSLTCPDSICYLLRPLHTHSPVVCPNSESNKAADAA